MRTWWTHGSDRWRGTIAWLIFALSVLVPVPAAAAASRIEIGWPTPNPAYLENRPLEAFVQPTESRAISSGLFGCTRTKGRQFHEGVDLRPLRRDSRGEATDEIFAILPGVVRHINRRAGDSSYGRYVVLEHPDQVPAVYSLYAHLSSLRAGLKVGDQLSLGDILGIMGRSAGGYSIPKDRAHLHFEIGLRLSDDFQQWYEGRKFSTRNQHGVWNGMNLLGVDPLEFYRLFRQQRVNHFGDYFDQLAAALRVRVVRPGTPDFVRRYPSLLARAPEGEPAGWEVTVDRYGMPFSWRPLTVRETMGMRRGDVDIVWTNDSLLESCRCKRLVTRLRGRAVPDRDLEILLQLLFGRD